MVTTAFWKALYTPGHDAACLVEADHGWVLEGCAVYLAEGLPTALNYRLKLTANWETKSGLVRGYTGGQPIEHQIRRDADGWLLNGVRQDGLHGVKDLDFGFTPATNFAQLRRINLAVGDECKFAVAWMDVDSATLQPLPQIYKRLSNRSYDYNSPQGPYRATLELQPNGFVSLYPNLWQAEPS
ncbi:putative glycolipid-binding domain-containing protein [Sphingomonas piscis]|uniref:Putative glycolipid-binding domain-containing protein n=1 Tax=Sphingomonas piscis TaxID=2714943 RepID=A0A6G7YSB3_9SPHN|nr:putative glycolipid-binding domain-containing protein [Sphingomonas piscis]QIK79630.1 putative glycolipid-binding domain-containing protein [Sphingomonas piscis]